MMMMMMMMMMIMKIIIITGNFTRTTTIHPGISGGRTLWADSVSPRMNTIAPRDQLKPIRIGENLVVNYK